MPTLEEFARFINEDVEKARNAGKARYYVDLPRIAEHFNITEYQASVLLKEYIIVTYGAHAVKTV